MHAAKILFVGETGKMQQKVLWDEINTMSLDHGTVSFQQRWDQMAGGAKSLRNDENSFADNNPNAKGKYTPHSLNFDFMADDFDEQAVQNIKVDGQT